MNMNNPVVSIVMPTYNVEKYISAAIVSVINQTYSDWELLVTAILLHKYMQIKTFA